MPLISRQSGPIAVYGATGYTGRLVAAELADAKADFIVAGRNREKLDALAGELGGSIGVRQATLDDPASLRDLMADCSVVVNCAGPFVLHGEPVLRAAVETSTHYLDTTGEQPYIKMAFERYGPGAAEGEVAVIPAMGFDYVPGDMIASLTAQGMGEVEEVALRYCWQGFTPSRGTARTTLEILSSPGVEWRNMEWRAVSGGVGRGIFEFPPPVGRRRMIRYPAGEQITVPRHVPTRDVDTTINAGAFSSDALARLFSAVMTPMGLAMRVKPLRRAAGALISRLPEGPTAEQREAMRWMIICRVRRSDQVRTGQISGTDVYGITAALISRAAVTAAQSGFSGRGALAPSQAFDPKELLAGLDRFQIRWEVDQAERVPVEA
ncbi:MAG: saccharopine dehydrogenase family protein [Solirubrobacterales bacterium]